MEDDQSLIQFRIIPQTKGKKGERKINFLNEVSSRVIKRDVGRDNPTRINYIREGSSSE